MEVVSRRWTLRLKWGGQHRGADESSVGRLVVGSVSEGSAEVACSLLHHYGPMWPVPRHVVWLVCTWMDMRTQDSWAEGYNYLLKFLLVDDSDSCCMTLPMAGPSIAWTGGSRRCPSMHGQERRGQGGPWDPNWDLAAPGLQAASHCRADVSVWRTMWPSKVWLLCQSFYIIKSFAS